MKCPYCKNEMIKGKICSNGVLWWKSETGDNVPLNDEGGFVGRINGSRITAFQCENCQKIIIDTKDIINR